MEAPTPSPLASQLGSVDDDATGGLKPTSAPACAQHEDELGRVNDDGDNGDDPVTGIVGRFVPDDEPRGNGRERIIA